jgi:SAM-dependent methyltransferase
MVQVEYLSNPTAVSMGDQWFEVVDLNHFWIKRRFSVLKKLFSATMQSDVQIAEVGSGNGLVQRQIEDELGKTVDGFDLNVDALEQNVVNKSKVYCYDITEKKEQLKEKYDVVLMMDVLEHITDQDVFLDATKFLLKSNGYLVINVPAFQSLYSNYDKSVGHIRRYAAPQLIAVLQQNGFKCTKWTYWGFSMVPLLWIRKILMRNSSKKDLIKKGMSPRFELGNKLLHLYSKLEWLPQKVYGTSLMAVFQKQ